MCTDNMPSGSALKLGDVLTFRNGKTAEIHNTDAEGRLILADGLALAAEEQPDAIVDIATLTGAALAALGSDFAAVIGSDADVVRQVEAAAATADEPVWELPLAADKYRKLLDSVVADMKNVGGAYAGATTAAIFLSEFVGDVPWAHIDIAGPMSVDADTGWKSKGATGFGTRLLIDLADRRSRPPDGAPTRRRPRRPGSRRPRSGGRRRSGGARCRARRVERCGGPTRRARPGGPRAAAAGDAGRRSAAGAAR